MTTRPSVVDGQIVASFSRFYIGSPSRLAALMEVDYLSVNRWTGGRRPTRLGVIRMCRLLMWGAAQWPDEARVEWAAMRVSSPRLPDPFQLSESVRFAYGGQRDGGALIRDAMSRMGLDQATHLGRLLGVPDRWRYKYVWMWRSGMRRCGSRYLMRLLALLLWDWRGYPVTDIWAVNWAARTVEWSWDGHSGAPTPLPGNPFEWLASTGRRAGRGPARRRLAVEPYPVSKVAYA